MTLWILCSGEADFPWLDRYDAAGFDAACRAALDGAPKPKGLKPLKFGARPVYVSTHPLGRETAAALCPEGQLRSTPLLDEFLPCHTGERSMPLWYWRRIASRAEKKAAAARAEELIALLEQKDEDCVAVSHPAFITLLLDQLRHHGYCITRSELGAIKPLERIRITRRDMHCGGCQHNCLLSAPGCGVGRDKAARQNRH